MPKKAIELKDHEVKKLKANGRFAVGGVDGLYLQVTNDYRSWVLCVAIGHRINQKGITVVKRTAIGLGAYPEISLKQARIDALNYRQQIKQGIDPLEEKRKAKQQQAQAKAKQKTFKECATIYLVNKEAEFENAKHFAQWHSTLATYVYPIMGNMPVSEITSATVMEIMQQVVSTKEGATTFWLGKNETASRVRGRIEVILDFAKFSKFCEGDNPASWKGNLAMALPKPSKVHTVVHHPALPLSELRTFLHELRERPESSARLLEFLILTSARSGEARGALWSEIDLEKKTWEVPAKRMKNKKIHTVPLNDTLIGILNAMPRTEGNPLIFPAPRGKVASDSIFKALFLRMKHSDFTTHGFRSTFKDWARTSTGNKYADEVSELALSHVDSDATRAAYARNELLEYRRELMDEWTEFCA